MMEQRTATMLIDSLQAVRRKVKLLGVAYGVGILFAALVALFLTTVLLDYLLNLPAVPRLIVAAGSVLVVGYIIVYYIARPMSARLNLSDVAGRLETAFPQFDDRLRSTVDFLGREIPGSEMMK